MLTRYAAALGLVLTIAACQPPDSEPPAATETADASAAAAGSVRAVPPARWHAVLVAGDNSSPAFDNAIDTLRDRLTEMKLGAVRTLSAAPSRASGAALSNSTNVVNALRNEGGDACFVYITSHGEEHGFFLRPDRRIFGPAVLDEALVEGCGTAPTVVVVSACHAGTFINAATRRPNRIIFAAAATDRTSFGCGAGDDYTYYDACFLQQLDSAQSWRELGVATRSCVEKLERQLGVPSESRPQMFLGAAVANLRLPGK